MKKAFALLLCFASLGASAQKINASKVPDAVKASFAKKFASATDAKWEQEKTEYEVEFKQGGQEMTANFDAAGNWKETEKEIAVTNLPASAKNYLQEHYKGEKIKEAAEITLANGSINYEAEVKGMDVIFDGSGKFLKEHKD